MKFSELKILEEFNYTDPESRCVKISDKSYLFFNEFGGTTTESCNENMEVTQINKKACQNCRYCVDETDNTRESFNSCDKIDINISDLDTNSFHCSKHEFQRKEG